MTHPVETKAQALALLILGGRTNQIARRLGVPKQSISRWRKEVPKVLEECILDDLRDEIFPDLWGKLWRLGQMRDKKSVNGQFT